MARKHRTFDEKETDRNNIITVLLQAKDWVRPGWVSKRIMTSSKNLVNHDLVTMVAGGTLQRTTKEQHVISVIAGNAVKRRKPTT